jgi:hypothetical protein
MTHQQQTVKSLLRKAAPILHLLAGEGLDRPVLPYANKSLLSSLCLNKFLQ